MAEPEQITHEDNWYALMGGASADVPDVLTHDDAWSAYISGVSDVEPPVLTHEDEWKKYIAENGGGGGDITVEPLTATENGTYNPGTGKAYKPVTVNVPEPVLDTLSVTENGTYTPEAGTDGFDEVVVNVQGGAATQEQLDTIAEGIGVATPSTPASIESTVDGLIADANEATGEADETLTDAVGSLIAGQGGGRILPEGYTQMLYLESSGTQYIDTGRVATINSKISVDARRLAPTTGYLSSFGSTHPWVYAALQYCSFCNSGEKQIPNPVIPWQYRHVLTMSAERIFEFGYDNVVTRSLDYTATGSSGEDTIFIFARNDNENPASFWTGRIFHFWWDEAGVRVLDMYPAMRDSDSVLGLYDIINDVFYTNLGEGEFIGGEL